MRQLPTRAIIGLLWAVASLSICQQTWAQDARALLAKTIQKYQSMTSYEGKGSIDATLITPNGSKRSMGAQSSVMVFKRPNKIMLKMNSDKLNIDIYGDGRNLTVYKTGAMKYFSLSSPTDMAAMLPVLHDRAEVDAILDPLFFLSNADLPSGMGTMTIGSNATVNGHEVFTLTGKWVGKPLVIAGKTNAFCTPGARWTLYIDRATALLQKVEARVSARVNVAVKNKGKIEAMPMAVTLTMQHVVVEAKPDAAANDSVFTFIPPKGATEQKDLKEMLKNSANAGVSR